MTETEGQHRLWGPGLDPAVGQGRVSYMGGNVSTKINFPMLSTPQSYNFYHMGHSEIIC